MHGVLTLAGAGSRMLPWTRGLRKEFLPLFDRGVNGEPIPKPVANMALESLVSAGVRKLVLVVSANDSALARKYFSVDRAFLSRHGGHPERLAETSALYRTLARLDLAFAVQRSPRGFGDAVLKSQPTIGSRPFVLHAGDAVLAEPHRGRLLRWMIRLRDREDLDAVLLARQVDHPTHYGVLEGSLTKSEGGGRRLIVRRIVEKPRRPRSHWAATALYCFSDRIYSALRERAKVDTKSELELTSGIQQLLSTGGSVEALILRAGEGQWFSVGSPEGYLRALEGTYRWSVRR